MTPQMKDIGVQDEYPILSRITNHKLNWNMANQNEENRAIQGGHDPILEKLQ